MDKQVAPSEPGTELHKDLLSPPDFKISTQRVFRKRWPSPICALTTSLWPSRSRPPRLQKLSSFYHTISVLSTNAWLIRDFGFHFRRLCALSSIWRTTLPTSSWKSNYSQYNSEVRPTSILSCHMLASLSVVQNTLPQNSRRKYHKAHSRIFSLNVKTSPCVSSQIHTYHRKWPKDQVTTPQERRPTGMCPGVPTGSTSTSTCQPPSPESMHMLTTSQSCMLMEVGGRGAEQGHGNAMWIPPDLETIPQHHENGVGSLPSQQQGS